MRYTITGEVYDFDPAKMTNVEGMAVEKVTGMTFNEWTEALKTGSMMALTAMVWVIQKRKEPTLRFGDVEFAMDALQIENDEADPKDEEVSTETG